MRRGEVDFESLSYLPYPVRSKANLTASPKGEDKSRIVASCYDAAMKPKFNNCIALGVADREAAASRFVESFEAEITGRGGDWVEVTAGPYKLYFVEDGTKDIAFSVDVPKADYENEIQRLQAHGFSVDEAISDRVKEVFVRDSDGILVNLYPAQ